VFLKTNSEFDHPDLISTLLIDESVISKQVMDALSTKQISIFRRRFAGLEVYLKDKASQVPRFTLIPLNDNFEDGDIANHRDLVA